MDERRKKKPSEAAIQDPRFKTVEFCSQGYAQTAMEKFTRDCVSIVSSSDTPQVVSRPPEVFMARPVEHDYS